MSRDKKRHGILNGRIAYHVINSGWTGNLLAILIHTSDMKAQGFCRPAPRFFQSSTSRNAPRKIWEAHAKIRFTILMQICDVIHQSPQSNACLLFDASQRANRYISNRMWHSDPSWLHRMLQVLYDFSAGHKTRYTLSTHLSSRDLQNLSSYPRPARWIHFRGNCEWPTAAAGTAGCIFSNRLRTGTLTDPI